MTSVNRPNRKFSDAELLRLNNLGLSLKTMAEILGCHFTTLRERMEALAIPPMDTRRSFMEDIYNHMTQAEREYLASYLESNNMQIKEYVSKLLKAAYIQRRIV